MRLWDYHTHNRLCNHADGTVEDYIQAAIAQGLEEIGISDHFPMDLLPSEANVQQFAMNLKEFPLYIAHVLELREKYQSQIMVTLGTEVDFHPDVFSAYQKRLHPFLGSLDYLIGSVHVIQFSGTAPFGVDERIALEKIKQFGEELVFTTYYDILTAMVNTHFFQIVGHMDLPKRQGVYLGETAAIWESQMKCLDAVQQAHIAIEINHSGYYRPVGIQYPRDALIREIVSRQIPLVLGSDAHSPDKVGYQFDLTMKKLHNLQKELSCPILLCKFRNRRAILVTMT